MRALLVFKKQNENGTILYRFERRDMGCFNGLNQDHAFTPRSIANNLMSSNLFIASKGTNGVIHCLPNADRDNTSGWEFMALGWMTDSVSNISSITNYELSPDNNLTSALHRESLLAASSDRQRTPNEDELRWLVERIRSQLQVATAMATNNLILSILRCNVDYLNSAAVEFVGSERNSGFAVAYLQVFRNTSRTAFDRGCEQRKATAYQLFQHMTERTFKGIVCSYLFNNGSDSDIFAFAGDNVRKQAMKFGLFSLEKFFRDTRPMVVEGRYQKGGQSDILNNNVSQKMESLNIPRRSDGTYSVAIEQIKSIGYHFDRAATWLSPDVFIQRGRSELLQHITNILNDNSFTNFSQNLQISSRMDYNWIDIRTERAAPVVARATGSFTQWVSQNDTIETE